jgi:hypothetical protein
MPRGRPAFPWFDSTGNQGSLPTVDWLFVTDPLPRPSVEVPLTGHQGLLPCIGDGFPVVIEKFHIPPDFVVEPQYLRDPLEIVQSYPDPGSSAATTI